jgi:hypothetical protein
MTRTAISAVLGLGLFVGSSFGATYNVDAAAGKDFVSIGEAFAVAADGDSIVVWPGTYAGENNRDIEWGDRNIVLTKAPDRQTPVIDLGGTGRFLVIESDVVDSSSVIHGLEIRNGSAPPPSLGGGAIRILPHQGRGASLVIELCTFVSNDAASGGAVEAIDSDVTVRFCRFLGNTGEYTGGLVLAGCRSVVNGCLFLDNTATIVGGALRCGANEDEYPIIRACTFARNGSPQGGAIAITQYSHPTLERCVIALSTEGAGVSTEGSAATEITHSIVYANAGGDSLPANHHDNLFRDPLFCDPGSDDFAVCEDSPALAGYNPWGLAVGSTSYGCPPCDTPVERSAWGVIKALYRRPGL